MNILGIKLFAPEMYETHPDPTLQVDNGCVRVVFHYILITQRDNFNLVPTRHPLKAP